MWERRTLPGGPERGTVPYRGELGARMPASEIVETDKEVIVTAEVPGVEKGDISINATEDSIEVSAEKKEEKKGYFMQERHYGRFYNNGVLEVRLPKTESPKRRGIKVE